MITEMKGVWEIEGDKEERTHQQRRKHSLKIDTCQAQRHHRIVLMLLALGLQSNYKY